MPILHDRIKDQLSELLPNYMSEEGQGFQTFLEAYFDFLEKGILVYKEGTELETVALEDGDGSLVQETATYAPSPVVTTKFLLEKNSATNTTQQGSWQVGEYVVGSTSGATARIDVLGNGNSKLYIELFTESHFLIDEEIVGQNSGYTAKVSSFTGNSLMAGNNLLSYADVDKTTGDFLSFFREDFMPMIDDSVIADKRILAKHISEIYNAKGSLASYQFLFRILYGEDISIAYPQDNVVQPSTSGWVETELLHLYSPYNLLDYPLGRIIKRNASQEIITNIQVDKTTRVTSGEGDNVYAIRVETPFLGTLSIGDTIELQSRENPLKFHYATVRGIAGGASDTDGSVVIRMEDASGNVGAESEESEGFLLEDGLQTVQIPKYKGLTLNSLVLEEATTGVTDLNEVHGSLPKMVRETVNTTSTEAVSQGSMYSEEYSKGSLYVVSDQVPINLAQSEQGVGQSATAMVGEITSGGIEEVFVDSANKGTGYSSGDYVVFDDRDSGGSLALGQISSTSGNMMLESGTTFGSFEYVATSGQVTFTGRDAHNSMMVYDPEKVMVLVKRSNESQTIASQGGAISFTVYEHVKGDANLTLTGSSVTFTGDYADNSHANYVGNAGTNILIFAQPEETHLVLEDGTGEGNLIYDQSGPSPTGSVARVNVLDKGYGFTSLPKVYAGGHIFYKEYKPLSGLGKDNDFRVGDTLVDNTGSTTWGTVVEHDTEIRKLVIAKSRTSTVTTIPSVDDTIKVVRSTGNITASVKDTDLTTGIGVHLSCFGKDIGTAGKLRIITEGNHFDKSGGLPSWPQRMVIENVSAPLIADTTITGGISGATGTIKEFDGDRKLLYIEEIGGVFKEGESVTASDSKTFDIVRTNVATSRATNPVVAGIDGNYTDDKGFPSVTSQRIHDSYYYQDFSYVIKVGESINKYRSIVKQLLNPAGTIFFGEVAISSDIDSRADIYNANFDGTRTTRSFVPILYIGSKIDPVKIILEDGTETGTTVDTFYGEGDNILLENDEGVMTSERFLVNDRMELTLELDSMSPAGALDFRVGEIVYQNQFKTTSGDLSTLRMKVVDRERDSEGDLIADPTFIIVENLIPDNTAIKQYLLEDPVNVSSNFDEDNNHFSGWNLPVPSKEAWQTNQTSENALHLPWGIIGESSGKKAEVASVIQQNVKTDQGSGQAFIAGEDIVESDVGLYDRIIRANVKAGGHEVIKELDILPHYTHHRMYYTTLDNTLPIGTEVVGATSGVKARVMEHDTENKFFVLYSGALKWDSNHNGEDFTTEAIKNLALSTTYFTATKAEIHYAFESEPVEQIQTEPVTSVSGKTATQGGAEPYAHADYLNGFIGRGKVLDASEPNEFYDNVMKNRTKNVIVTQTFASANTKSGKTLNPVPSAKEDANQQGTRQDKSASNTATTLNITGGLDWGDTIQSANRDSILNNLATGRTEHKVPSDSKRYNSVRISDHEQLLAEDGSRLVAEPDHGHLMLEPKWEEYNASVTTDGKQYYNNGWVVDPTEELLLEDGGKIQIEDATDIEVAVKLVTERTPNFGSMYLRHEDHGRIIFEDDSVLVQEMASSIIPTPTIAVGPTLGDISKMGFSSTLEFEERLRQESGNAVGTTPTEGNNWDKGDDILMENETGKLLVEAPYEGVKISDISTLYGNIPISELEINDGMRTSLTFSASVQSGA